jgi:hypothetical protein
MFPERSGTPSIEGFRKAILEQGGVAVSQKKKRKCPVCGTVLSRHNRDTHCEAHKWADRTVYFYFGKDGWVNLFITEEEVLVFQKYTQEEDGEIKQATLSATNFWQLREIMEILRRHRKEGNQKAANLAGIIGLLCQEFKKLSA